MAESSFKESADLDSLLAQLPIEMRGKTLSKAVKKGAKVVQKETRRRAPRGDVRHKPENKALRDSIIVINKKYKNETINMAIVGPSFPDGAHGHLVESGHKVVVSRGARKGEAPLGGSASVAGKAFLAPAVDSTEQQQEEAVVGEIVKGIQKVGG